MLHAWQLTNLQTHLPLTATVCCHGCLRFTSYKPSPSMLTFCAAAAAVCEARNSVSTGFKRSHDPGAFMHSDTYWGYEERGDIDEQQPADRGLGEGVDGLGVEEEEEEGEGAAAAGRRLCRQVVLVQEAATGQQGGCGLRKRRCWRDVRMAA